MLLLDLFLPINTSPEFFSLFLVIVQLFSALAVLNLYTRRLLPLRGEGKQAREVKAHLWLLVFVGTLPAAIVGFFLDELVETVLSSALVIAVALIAYGIVFLFSHKFRKNPIYSSAEDLSVKSSLKIGLFQVLSLIPGTSRSGATIMGGIVSGCTHAAASDFAFLLSLPVMAGASLLRAVKFFLSGDHLTTEELLMLLLGGLTAFLVSTLAVRFFTDFMKKHSLRAFGIYRILLGIAVLFFSLSSVWG